MEECNKQVSGLRILEFGITRESQNQTPPDTETQVYFQDSI